MAHSWKNAKTVSVTAGLLAASIFVARRGPVEAKQEALSPVIEQRVETHKFEISETEEYPLWFDEFLSNPAFLAAIPDGAVKFYKIPGKDVITAFIKGGVMDIGYFPVENGKGSFTLATYAITGDENLSALCEKMGESGVNISRLYEELGKEEVENAKKIHSINDKPGMVIFKEGQTDSRPSVEAWYEYGKLARAGGPSRINYLEDGSSIESFKTDRTFAAIGRQQRDANGVLQIQEITDADGMVIELRINSPMSAEEIKKYFPLPNDLIVIGNGLRNVNGEKIPDEKLRADAIAFREQMRERTAKQREWVRKQREQEKQR